MRMKLNAMLNGLWYGPAWRSLPLWPLGGVFHVVVVLRRRLYQWGLLTRTQLTVPVIVVGNITVGGTGKTPLVIGLVELLKRQGYRPGVMLRGYGGKNAGYPKYVNAQSEPHEVGDEAVLLARRCACPVVAGSDRVAAGRMLADGGCNVVVSDDGLQHYRLMRDLEIIVIDALRGLGNRHCLPAGPLREPPRRLRDADLVVVNGGKPGDPYALELVMGDAVPLRGGERAPLNLFRGRRVHAVAAIGHPKRFFNALRRREIQVIEHAFPDHYLFNADDLRFDDDLPIIMTEKDAVKCLEWAPANSWYVPVTVQLGSAIPAKVLRSLNAWHESQLRWTGLEAVES